MKHEIKDGIIYVYETGSKNNKLLLRSDEILNTDRRVRFNIYDYLKSLDDSTLEYLIYEIHKSFGKFIRLCELPKRIEFGNYKTDVSIRYLKKNIEEFISDYGLDLNPNFQRGHVWTNEQRVKFIEFLLEGGKPSPILLNHTNWMKFSKSKDDKFVIVDGLQRLTALLMFIDDELTVYNEFKYSYFDNVSISVQIYVNNLKTDKEVLKWYLELNEGQTPHTKEELERVRQLLLEVE
jgi:hypothetical protein